MIVIFQGVYLLITTTFDLGFLVLGKMSSELIVLRRLFATAVLTLNQWNIVPYIAQSMPLNVMSSLPLLLVTWDMVAMQGN